MNVGTAGVELLLGITGLCGLMPLDRAEPPRLGIVCVDAEDANGVQPHDTDHFTGLLVNRCSVLAESGWKAGERDCQKENDGKRCEDCGFAFYPVDRMRIWLENAPDAQVDVYRCGLDPTAVCPSEDQNLCFDWVPPMKRLSPRRPVSPLLEMVADRRVSAVLELSGGRLTAGSLGATDAGPPPVWRMDAGGTFGTDFERVMAESMVYYRNLGDDVEQVEVCLCSLDEPRLGSSCSTECSRSLTLGPGESGDIELLLTNQPEEHRFPGEHRFYRPPFPNRHFPHLYRLLDGPVHTPVPRVLRACRANDEKEGELLEMLPPEVEDRIHEFLRTPGVTAGNVMCPGADYGGG